MFKKYVLWNRPRIEICLTDYWDMHRIYRYNSGYPFMSYAIGPIRIRKYWR